MSQNVTRQECEAYRDSCRELSDEKRGRIMDEIKAIRREIRLGYSLISLFITAVGVLIGIGVI